LLRALGIRSLLDFPCGDLNWMSKINLSDVQYTGSDVVPEIIKGLNEAYASHLRNFLEINVVEEVPDTYDAIVCQYLFVHLGNQEIFSEVGLAI